jgi:hypothetical protein
MVMMMMMMMMKEGKKNCLPVLQRIEGPLATLYEWALSYQGPRGKGWNHAV